MLLLLLSAALAAAPHGDLHAMSGVGADGSAGALVGGSVGVRLHELIRVGARADAGLLPRYGAGAALRPELRLTVTDPLATWGRFDLVGGIGARLGTRTGLLGFGGAALEVPAARAWDLRVEGGYLFDDTGLGAAVLAVGPVFDIRRRRTTEEEPPPPPPPPPVVAVAEPPPAAAIETDVEGVEVWFPHPVCRWMPLEDANALLAAMGHAEVQVVAPGYRSTWLTVDGPTQLGMEPVAEVGSLVVVSAPGDRLTVDGRPVTANPDGVLLLSSAPGAVRVDIVGNGRRQELDLVVAAEMTTWARATEPAPLHVTFPADSAVLSPRGLAEIKTIADAIGDATFTVEGSYSPEGDVERNRELARLRALAGQQALLAAGVSKDRITLITEPKSIDSDDWRVLRAAVITPSGMPR